MNRKRNKTKQLKILKNLPAILIYVLIFPANYSGKTLRLKTNSCGSEFPSKECPQSTVKFETNVNDATTSNPADDKVGKTAELTGNVVIISLLLLILSTILISLILRYFNGVSILKQSLILFLYQDSARLILLLNGSLSLAIFTLYSIGNVVMPPTLAKIFTYCILNLLLHLLLASNVSAFLHLYSMKEMVIVPPWAWMEDERVAMKKMRLTSLGIVTFGMTLMFAYHIYPEMYYIVIGDRKPFKEWTIGKVLFLLFLGLLVITYTISSVAATFYERRCIYVGETRLPRCPWPILFVIVICLSRYWAGNTFWKIALALQLSVGVLAIAIIASSCQLRGFVRGIIQDFQDATLLINYYFVPYLSLRSPQVHPIQE